MHLLFGTHINLILLKRSKPCKIAQQDSSTQTTLIIAVSLHLNLKVIFLTSNHGAKFPGSAFFRSFITHHLAALLLHQLTAFHAASSVIRKLSIPPMPAALRIFFHFSARQQRIGTICPPTPCSTPTPPISRHSLKKFFYVSY